MDTKPNIRLTPQCRRIWTIAALAVFFLGIIYAVTTILGFISLNSPQDPISDPFFTLMELLIILMAPLMIISMIAVHAYADSEARIYSAIALVFMILMAVITSVTHFVILTVSRQIEAAGFSWGPLFFSFRWPSVVYALDILAWDWFFALSMLFAAPVFGNGRLQKIVKTLLIITGVLSLAGLVGVPLENMQIRNIGIVGYGIMSPFVFLLLGIIFGRTRTVSNQ